MLKKFLSMSLALMILTVASGVHAFARTGEENRTNRPIVEQKKKEVDLKTAIDAKSKASALNVSNKSTLAEYERAKRQGKGMSNTTKVLIGVGIAVAVVAVVAIAASRDKIRTF